ncbi:glycosyltransferase [Accumulibacter sp.]|uniref:glycosyltransferase n=1 Tax=Accumulibacter sp. TaxID=2053492 RepID=UPI0028C4D43E|nr:glycosyltransferase [Accumulibacter sp.]
MKILYLAEWDAYSSNGVIRKIKAQFDTWLRMGVDARLVIVSPRGLGRAPAPQIQGERVHVVPYPVAEYGFGKFYKALALRKTKRLIREFSPDVIYYRQSSWTPGILGVLALARAVVTEVNSNDVYEAHQYGWLKAHYHLATRNWVIDRVRGFVCVGREVGAYYQRYGKPVAVVGNGFDTRSVQPRTPLANARPQLVFVGSAGQAWHGVDKLLAVADQLADMDFHIVGAHIDSCPSNLKSYGYMTWEQLSEMYRRMDIGFASLALHRLNIEEISPLKTREYLAYGIPVIGAYDDTDLGGCECFLRLPNTETGVVDSVDLIRDFVFKWKGKAIDMNYVRARIDSSVKESERIGFMRQVLGQAGT